MTMTATLTTRACDGCGQVTDYEPVTVGTRDLMSTLPHYCADCSAALERAEIQRTAERAREKREAAWLSTVPKKYQDTKISHPDFPRKLWEGLAHWPLDKSVGLIGPSGRCKTRVLALLAKRAIAADMFVGWCPATSFQWAAQNQWDDQQGGDARKWLRRWQDCAVLFLDDLGKHRWTEAVESEFFALIDLRSSRGLPMHWTMNPLPEDEDNLLDLIEDKPSAVLGRALDPTGAASKRPRFAPIVSRLMDGTGLFPVF